jgi:hypothetical protein
MNTATLPDDDVARPDGQRPRHRDGWLYGGIAVMLVLSWVVSRTGLVEAGNDLGYGLGVAGGVLMLVLLLYPLRKYLRVMRNLGSVKAWFWMHMLCGIAGPWLILVHSTYRIGSLNAGVALFSMLIVVASGVIGRFLFVRVQHDLDGGQANLQGLRERLGLAGSEARSMLAFAPDIETRLQRFEARELPGGDTSSVPLLRLLGVPVRRWLEHRRCRVLLEQHLTEQAGQQQWSPELLAQRRRRTERLLRRYFDSVLRVAHFSLFDRLFALWHVAHLPFVVLLALSAVVHVVAVHAY